MKIMPIAFLFLGLSQLVSCNAAPDNSGPGGLRNGRYVGIGVFNSGTLWSQIKGAKAAQDTASAGLVDDEHIIVVVDTNTGEIRECGDYSGYCTSMNPWTKPLDQSQHLPVSLAKHSGDIAAENKDAAPASTP